MKVTNIIWSIGDDGSDFNQNDYDLPTEVEIPDGIDVMDIADYLSDEYGLLVESFSLDTTPQLQRTDFRASVKEQICKTLTEIFLKLNDDLLPNWEDEEDIYVECDEISKRRISISVEVGNTYDSTTCVEKWVITAFVVTLDSNLYLQFEDDQECDWTDVSTDDLVAILDYLQKNK